AMLANLQGGGAPGAAPTAPAPPAAAPPAAAAAQPAAPPAAQDDQAARQKAAIAPLVNALKESLKSPLLAPDVRVPLVKRMQAALQLANQGDFLNATADLRQLQAALKSAVVPRNPDLAAEYQRQGNQCAQLFKALNAQLKDIADPALKAATMGQL